MNAIAVPIQAVVVEADRGGSPVRAEHDGSIVLTAPDLEFRLSVRRSEREGFGQRDASVVENESGAARDLHVRSPLAQRFPLRVH